jgi:hypothetical protein
MEEEEEEESSEKLGQSPPNEGPRVSRRRSGWTMYEDSRTEEENPEVESSWMEEEGEEDESSESKGQLSP